MRNLEQSGESRQAGWVEHLTGHAHGWIPLVVVALLAVAVLVVVGRTPLVDAARGWAITPASPMVSPLPNPPVIYDLDGDSTTYSAGNAPVILDQSSPAAVLDDDPTFAGGELRVSITEGKVASEDVLALATGGAVSLSAGMTEGSEVEVFRSTVGTLTGTGRDGADLVVDLHTYAGPIATSVLLQAVTYENVKILTPSTGSRTVTFVVLDGDEGQSNPAAVTVIVFAEDPEVIYLPVVLNGYAAP